MGLRGPAAKPTAYKVLEGTYREDRHGGGVRAPDGLPVKPNWLGETAAMVWDKTIDELRDVPGLLSPMDGPALACYCLAWQELHEADATIAAEGLTCQSEKGATYQHPAVGIRHKAIELIAKIGAKFGMTPSDRAGLKPAVQTTQDAVMRLVK
jgi:P27 family predicted phage terminase small subunit